jgi:uncharacterized protein YdaU (DUF1376 family)
MTELPYRPEHVADAMADSDELTNEELGAYVRLQRAFWRAGGFLPAKDLSRFSRAGKRWGAIGPMILRKLTITEGKASCSAILDLLLRTRDRRAKAAERASMAATARWGSKDETRRGSVATLKTPKLLINHNVTMLEALVTQSFGHSNQNQNQNLASKSLIKSDDATGGREVYEVGVKLLTERVGVRMLAARSQIAKWLVIASEDDLGDILQAASAENLRGSGLVSVVDQRVRAVKQVRERGEPLPFGFQPNIVREQ